MESLDIQRRREGVLVQGAIGQFLMVELFTVEQIQEAWDRGEQVPLDLMPADFWSPPDMPFPRFGEEMLGPEF